MDSSRHTTSLWSDSDTEISMTETKQKDCSSYEEVYFLFCYLSVEPDREDVVGVAVVANLCALLEMVNVHSPWHGQTDHHHQAAGEQPLHYINIWTLNWEGTKGKVWVLATET